MSPTRASRATGGRTAGAPLLALIFVASCLWSFHSSPIHALAQSGSGILRVSPSGSDVIGCGGPALPCQSIQWAVNHAASGDEIRMAAGDYVYNQAADGCSGPLGTTAVICVVNKDVTILGGYSPTDWSASNPAANLTVVDGQNSYRGVFVATTDSLPHSLRLEGLRVENGVAHGIPARPGDDKIFAFGGGMFADTVHDIVLRDVVFRNNRSLGDNTSTDYGGAGSGGGVAFRLTTQATLERVVFQGNEARGGSGAVRGGYGHGGALYTDRTTITARNITCTDNLASGGSSGGAGADSTGQRADALGGALNFQSGTTALVEHLVATSNLAAGGDAVTYSGGAFGGAVKVEQATLVLRDSELRLNSAIGGHAVNGWLGNGGGLEAIDSDITIERSFIISNTARGGNGTTGDKGAAGGGGINSTWITAGYPARLTMSNTIVADNLAEMGGGTIVKGGGGGGIWVQATQATLSHLTVARNRIGPSMQGQGILLIEVGTVPAVATIAYSVIAEHTWTGASPPAALHVKRTNTVTLLAGRWSGNTKDSNANDTPSSSHGTFINLGEMQTIPSSGFVSPGAPNRNYHIRADSALRDAATSSTMAIDVDGDSRVAPRDIGADEYTPFLLMAIPTPAGQLLDWTLQANRVAGIDHFLVVVSCAPGANPPAQITCGAPVNVGVQTRLLLAGLTAYVPYTSTVTARDAAGALVATSTTVVQGGPTFFFLPLVVRGTS
jgi:hypothetical protein